MNARRHHPDVEPPICSLCGGTVEEIRRDMHWHGPAGCGMSYSGRCVACDVDFIRHIGTPSSDWHLVASHVRDLQSLVSAEELMALSRKLARHKVHNAKWQSFLARRRAGDEIWHFRSHSDSAGIAIVRNGIPVLIAPVVLGLNSSEERAS